jgi:tetratricopeptide (TPR) repeat protein
MSKIAAALLVIGLIVATNFLLFHPGLRNRVDYAFLRMQTAIKKLQPHPEYIPTPVLPTPTKTTPSSESDPTPLPTATHTPTPVPTTTPVLTEPPVPQAVQLETDCHEPQGWNNCGPATLAMALCFYGWTQDQYAVAAVTKPDKDDKNVSPDEMVAYVYALQDTCAVMGYATDIELLKRLVSNGFPVIVETWFIPEPGDEMGHYRLVTGYDDLAGEFTTQDAYQGADQHVPYQRFDERWKVFNRAYVVVCEDKREPALRALLGERLDQATMYQRALSAALDEIQTDPSDRFAWFNAGTNYTGLQEYEQAATAYDRARMLNLPWRMLWYQFGPFEAYLQVGRYQEVLALANANLETTPNLEESYYYRALARRALGDEQAAQQDLQQALKLNPNFDRAACALDE